MWKILLIVLLAVPSFGDDENDVNRHARDNVIEIEKHIDFREIARILGNPRKVPGVREIQSTSEDSVLRWLNLFQLRDSGHTTNCDASGPKFDITWTPLVVSKSEPLSLTIDAVAACKLSTATIEMSIKIGPQSRIMKRTMTCSDLQMMFPGVTCPIQKGVPLKSSSTVPSMVTGQLPSGHMEVKMKITNEMEELFACVEASVDIK